MTYKRHQVYCNRCQFHISHGKVLPWTSSLIFQEHLLGMMGSGQLFADSANRHISFPSFRKKIKPEHMVKIFMQNIFKYRKMPQSIISDRDPRMTSLFWKALFENMSTTLKFSTSFHPQTDGQSEEANSTILDLLKCYVSEHKSY